MRQVVLDVLLVDSVWPEMFYKVPPTQAPKLIRGIGTGLTHKGLREFPAETSGFHAEMWLAGAS